MCQALLWGKRVLAARLPRELAILSKESLHLMEAGMRTKTGRQYHLKVKVVDAALRPRRV